MRCEEVREQFADYVIDSLTEPMRARVDEHLRMCNPCRTEATEMRTLWANLGAIPATQPGPELRARFDVMLQAYQHGREQAAAPAWWERLNSWLAGWFPRQPVFQFGIALVLLAAGIGAGWMVRPAPAAPQPNAELSQLRGELSEMRQMVALTLMQQQSASDRLKGVSWSYQVQPGREIVTALLDTLMHDANVNVRLATVDALRQFGDQPGVRHGVVEAMTHQESPMVQIALIDLAVDLHEKESVQTLRQLSQDQTLNQAVRQRAEKGLTELE